MGIYQNSGLVAQYLFWSYWGKARQDDREVLALHALPCHCLDVAAVVHCLLEADPRLQGCLQRAAEQDITAVKPWLLFLAALHDLGKYHPGFQAKAPEAAAMLGQPPYLRSSDVAHWDVGLWLWVNKLTVPEGLHLPAIKPWRDHGVLTPLAEAAFGHHGRPAEPGCSITPHHRQNIRAAQACADAMAALFLRNATLPRGDQYTLTRLSWPYAGLLVLADWIGSAEQWFPPYAAPMPLERYYRERALPQARLAVTECGVLLPPSARKHTFTSLFPDLADRTSTPLQTYAQDQAVERQGPQMHIFEDLTGSGKTEAALLCANALMDQGECGGLYIGLPTMATANAMYARMAEHYRALFEPGEHTSLMLAHSARSIHDTFLASIPLEDAAAGERGPASEREDSGPTCAAWLADNRKKALLAPCGVGTLDQALLGILPARHQSLRLLGLSRLVLIADEVHAYDAYTRRLLCALLEFMAMLGSSAVILTATLPLAQRRELCDAFSRGLGQDPAPLRETAFPLATRVDADGCRETPLRAVRNLDVETILTDDIEDMYAALTEAHRAGACACWIRNTVDQALEARRHLVEDLGLPSESVLLFHARFTQSDRLTIEEEVLRRFGPQSRPADRAGRILISTQVVEQSLDADWDLMLSDLAPMDLIIQRAGRCQRHPWRKGRPTGYDAPRMMVLSPRPTDDADAGWYRRLLGNAAFVYPMQAPLWRTARLLAERGGIHLPRDARALVEGTYGANLPAPVDIERADAEPQGKEMGKDYMARYNALDAEVGYATESAANFWAEEDRVPTREGEDRVTVRLVRTENGKVRLWVDGPVNAKTCARSEVALPSYYAQEESIPAHMNSAVEELREKMPDKARHCLLLALEPGEDGTWVGVLHGKKGNTRFGYCPTTGLQYSNDLSNISAK